MKKILLFALSMYTFGAIAQVEIHEGSYAGPDVSGQTVTYVLDPADFPDEYSYWSHGFYVVNNTGSDANWTVVRRKLNVPAGWSDNICWPANCLVAGPGEYFEFVDEPTIILNGLTTNNAQINTDYYNTEMKPQIYPNLTEAGSATYRYYIKSVTTQEYVDSVTIEFSFPLSVEENKTTTLSIAPNPANEYVALSLEGAQSAQVKIVDVLGNVVYTKNVNASTKINVAEFRNGIYFVTIEGDNNKTTTKKLIVKH